MKDTKINGTKRLIPFYIILFATSSLLIIDFLITDSFSFIFNGHERENGLGKHLSKNFGTFAIILFGLVAFKSLIFFIYKFSRKLPDEPEYFRKSKEFIKLFFMKTRKSLRYLHYIAGLVAIVLLTIHGIALTDKNLILSINGWIAFAVLTFYVLSGIIMLFKSKFKGNLKHLRKYLAKIHRNLLLFVFILVFHIIHLLLAD